MPLEKIVTTKTEGRCVDDAGTELCKKCFFYTIRFIGTKVVADDRLSALADSLKRKRDKLADTGNDRHCPDRHITAESGKTARNSPIDRRLSVDSTDKGRNTKSKAGTKNLEF